MRSLSEKDAALEKALKKYALENSINNCELEKLSSSIPLIKAKVSVLTQKEIDEIKQQVPKDELSRITKLISEVK